jgi:hypothetical protein
MVIPMRAAAKAVVSAVAPIAKTRGERMCHSSSFGVQHARAPLL